MSQIKVPSIRFEIKTLITLIGLSTRSILNNEFSRVFCVKQFKVQNVNRRLK